MKNKAYVITLDAIIALVVVLTLSTTFILVYEPKAGKTSVTSFKNLHYLSEDVLDVLNKQGVLDEVGTEWARANGSTTSEHWSNATNISREYLEKLIPGRYGYRLIIDDTGVIYDSDSDPNSTRPPESEAFSTTHSTRLLVGYGKGLPTRGHVARAFLANIQEKTTSEYLYFGGFVGQGNLTKIMVLSDSLDTVTDAYVEVASGTSFDLFVNGNSCGSFTPTVWNMSANVKENLTCLSDFKKGNNNIDIKFTDDDLSGQYIGGGFIKVTYNTSQMDTSQESGTSYYNFPGINGLINLYSSFYVPGTLNSMKIHLEFLNNYTTYLTIGDQKVFNSSGNGVNQSYDLDDGNLSMLAYGDLSMETVPIRLGIGNVSYLANVTGNADIILITDLSGSMNWRLDSGDTGTDRECDDPLLYDPSTRRISLAKCLDKEFIDIILNSSGNRVGLVGYRDITPVSFIHTLSDNKVTLKNQISGYGANSGTCICCAINKAYELLSSSNASRQKFIVVMTDGIPSHACQPSSANCEGNSSTAWWQSNWGTGGCYGWQECCNCPYLPEVTGCSGQNCWSGWPYCCDCFCACDCEMQNANYSSCRAHNDLNATVHSIGFGPISNCSMGNWTLQAIATCGNGSYYASSNASELELIYQGIAQQIVNVSYMAQTATITGNITPSILYPESYIRFSYTPLNTTSYGEITLTQDTERFGDTGNCTGILFIPEIARVIDAKVTSYSAEYWTDYLLVNNQTSPSYTLRSGYGSDYRILGDPYIVHIPYPSVDLIPGENNSLEIRTGNSPTEDMGCSPDNRAIYTIRLMGRVGYAGIFPEKSGCNWNIRFEDDTDITEMIPDYYNGTKECHFSPENISYDINDAIDDSLFRLLETLDSNNNTKTDIKFDSSMIEFDFSQSGGVRSLWGPITMKLIIWV